MKMSKKDMIIIVCIVIILVIAIVGGIFLKKAEGRKENRNKNRYLITRVSERENKPAENPDACTRNFRSDERGQEGCSGFVRCNRARCG